MKTQNKVCKNTEIKCIQNELKMFAYSMVFFFIVSSVTLPMFQKVDPITYISFVIFIAIVVMVINLTIKFLRHGLFNIAYNFKELCRSTMPCFEDCKLAHTNKGK